MTDTQNLFGKILTSTEGERDAVHVAVVPVVAACLLGPGDHVGINTEGRADDKVTTLGIVDPFLRENVQVGQRFFVFLYPNTITSLKHRWSHPAFPEDDDQERSVAVASAEVEARRICQDWDGPDYDTMLQAFLHGHATWSDSDDPDYAGGVSIRDDYVRVGGRDAGGNIPDRFWDLMETITGQRARHRPRYFSCAC